MSKDRAIQENFLVRMQKSRFVLSPLRPLRPLRSLREPLVLFLGVCLRLCRARPSAREKIPHHPRNSEIFPCGFLWPFVAFCGLALELSQAQSAVPKFHFQVALSSIR